MIYLEELSFKVVLVISIIIFSNSLIRNSHLRRWCIYNLQTPKQLFSPTRQSVQIFQIFQILKWMCYPIRMSDSLCWQIRANVILFGNTTWWEKLKVWCLEINENIVRIGQCKADVCLLTLYKAKIGVSPSSILAYLTDLSWVLLQRGSILQSP